MEPNIANYSIFVNERVRYSSQMKAAYTHTLDSTKLSELSPLLVLRILRDRANELDVQKSVGFFKLSDSSGDAFIARLSVIGVDPLQLVQSQNENPFQRIQEELNESLVSPLPSLPFFQGGMMGYIAYDSVGFLEPVLKMNEEKFKGSSSRTNAEVVLYKTYLIFDHVAGRVTLLDAESKDSLIALEKEILAKSASAQASNAGKNQIKKIAEISTEEMTSNLGKEKFLAGIQKLKHHIREGDIFQAVLSEQFSHPYSGDTLDLFEILAEISPAPYQFYFTLGEKSYLGASPEMLLKSTGETIETHPIAGTRPRGVDAEDEKRQEQQLMKSVKERAEHLMLVDLARNDIGRVSKPGTVSVNSFMKLRKFGGVMHLVSTVTGKRKSETAPLSAFASCFPAGTLSGAPKIRAMDLISEIEGKPRGFYGGAFIVASVTGDLDSCIAIRSISVENGIAIVQAGAGIVADSMPEKEYAEIQHKTKKTRTALGTALARLEARS
jgi:anthranilate synthase component 1